jgi:hypothetical protein
MRLGAGLVVQPFVAAGVAFFGFPLFLLEADGRTLAGGFPSDPSGSALAVAFGTAIVALVVTLVGVWPTALWLVKRRPVTLAQSLLFGLAFGNVPVALGGMSAGFHGLSGAFRAIAFASVIGITGAAVFWAISLRTAGYNGPTPRRFGSRYVERNQ